MDTDTERQPGRVFILPTAYPRIDLIDALPLPNPISMQIDPASLCNFKCSFCPTGDVRLIKESGRTQTFLKMELYEKILADISEFSTNLKVLKLFKDGEPTLNPNFIAMVAAAKKVARIERVETTSNGSRLCPDFNVQLVQSGLDRIVLSIEGVTSERYLKFARVKFDFDTFVNNVRHLYLNRGNLKVHIKTVAQNLDYGLGEDRIFLDTFGPLSDGIFIENTVSSWPEFKVDEAVADDVDAYGGLAVRKSICPYLFYSMSINADGIVSPCCVDWNRSLALGSVADQSLLEIWAGEKLRDLRLKHVFDGLETVKSCNSCGQVRACMQENLDGHRERLKSLLS